MRIFLEGSVSYILLLRGCREFCYYTEAANGLTIQIFLCTPGTLFSSLPTRGTRKFPLRNLVYLRLLAGRSPASQALHVRFLVFIKTFIRFPFEEFPNSTFPTLISTSEWYTEIILCLKIFLDYSSFVLHFRCYRRNCSLIFCFLLFRWKCFIS